MQERLPALALETHGHADRTCRLSPCQDRMPVAAVEHQQRHGSGVADPVVRLQRITLAREHGIERRASSDEADTCAAGA
ncbi:hypothetical protein [Luteimonas deserti]|nr:hypothetical protein [Luteimonas deserti]